MRSRLVSTARRAVAVLGANAGAQQTVQPVATAWRAPPPLADSQCQQQRGLQILELFSKEAREKRRQRLQEDLQRGYFDDFKELKDTAGKLWRSPDRIIPADAARPFPRIQVARAKGTDAEFPCAPGAAPAASLVCVGFKNGCEDMLASWSRPFAEKFASASGAALVELSVIESQVMALWPFRSMIMQAASSRAAAAASSRARSTKPASAGAEPAVAPAAAVRTADSAAAASPAAVDQLRAEYLFVFGDAHDMCRELQITNRLTGYVFLLDRQGRVRFRGCGNAEAAEVSTLTGAAEQLLDAG